ncbi:FHA domain-containing protein [Anaerolineales bacterium HSG24]|nr:FHA domain-containing protein [Anaerolineales bacterium HSG24]
MTFPAPNLPKLTALKDNIHPSSFPLEVTLCLIGRLLKCEIVIQQTKVSRYHAKIERHGSRYILSDTHSTNGTFVNGERIHDNHPLQHGDKIGIGDAESMLRFDDPDSTDIVRNWLYYDRKKMSFFFKGRLLPLSGMQTRLLLHLYENRNMPCSRKDCVETVWQRPYEPGIDDDALNRMVSKLRNTLGKISPDAANMIVSHRGVGYELSF